MAIEHFSGLHRFLSNFWRCPVWFRGEVWPSAEHAYQSAKSYNDEYLNKVRLARSPFLAKKLGQNVPLDEHWNEDRIGIMCTVVRSKFMRQHSINIILRGRLLATDNQELIEGNDWGDTFWGVCNGIGENNLGKILMMVRTELRGV